MAERVDPLQEFRFAVEIQGLIVGLFTECGGLSVERDVLDQPEGGLNYYVNKLPGQIKTNNITLKRGVADNVLWEWFCKGLYDGKVERHSVSVIMYNLDQTEARRWDIPDAFPVSWAGPEFRADSDQVAIETIEIGSGEGEGGGEGGGEGEGGLDFEGEEPDEDGKKKGQMQAQVDVPALADEVYGMLKKEMMWELNRLGQSIIW